jgi:hypothetical protein
MAGWDDDLETQLSSAIGEFQSRYKRQITAAGIDLLRLTISAIAGEPRPAGVVPNEVDVRSAQLLAIRMIPVLLRSLLSREEGPIGVFQLLEAAPRLLGMYFIFAYPP